MQCLKSETKAEVVWKRFDCGQSNNWNSVFVTYIDCIHKWRPRKLFFCLCVNHAHSPHIKAKLLLNFVHANEASQDNSHKNMLKILKTIIILRNISGSQTEKNIFFSFSGSLLACWTCTGSTYEECQQNLVLSNCSSETSCFQLNVNLRKANESTILFSKGCLVSSDCDDYRTGNAGFCRTERADGYSGTCFGECCDGEGCNKGDLLATNPTNKGTAFIISLVVLLCGLILTVVNIG